MPSKKPRITVYLSPEEHVEISGSAARTGMSLSTFAKRRKIENMGIHKRNRRNLLALARKHEKEAIAKVKLEISPERETVRREIPYTSWQDFLKLEAGNGNEVALAVLCSRKEAVEPEATPALERTQSTPPQKGLE